MRRSHKHSELAVRPGWLYFAAALCLASARNAAAEQPNGSDGTRQGMVALASRADAAPLVETPAVSNVPSNVVYLKPGRAAPGVSSSALTLQAWKALEKQEFDKVILLTEECAHRFGARAQKQQAVLKNFADKGRAFVYSALNDVATCIFIKGKALRTMQRFDDAKTTFREVIRDYRFAQCWDPRGWFWKVASGAQDEINCIDYNIDFGDYTSATLTAKAWKAYTARRYDALELYVRKCLELYGDAARKMQADLADYAPKEQAFDFWALNDVATCLFIRGKALQKQGRNKEAALVYRDILDNYTFAQCWDPSGWFWKVADEARRTLAFCS